MKTYKNISKVSGVESYDYDSILSYVTVKFKTGEILTYTTEKNSPNIIKTIATLADLGVGLNRYLTANKPPYYKGVWVAPRVDNSDSSKLNINKLAYPLGRSIESVRYNNGRDWVEIKYNSGRADTYTIESTGKRDVIGLINAAVKGYGLSQYISENKPTPVEKIVSQDEKGI